MLWIPHFFEAHWRAAPLPHHVSEVEEADCNTISGWVWDKYKPNAQVNVDLWDGEQYLMTFPANQFRQDLVDAGYGDGRHGFRILTPPVFKDGHSHTIHLRIAGTKSDLTNMPKVIVCR